MSNIKLLNEDCMEVMARYPDRYFDLAIVDPPYGLPKDAVHGRGKLKNRAMNSKDMSWDIAPDQSYFEELFRVSKNQIIWGGNYFNLPGTRCFVVWDKVQPWENFSAFEYAWTSFSKPSKKYIERATEQQDKIHPTQKSVKLYQYCLSNFANPNDRILDTHLGSASSAIASYLYGHEFVGCELNKTYFDHAFKRVSLVTSQQTLFKAS